MTVRPWEAVNGVEDTAANHGMRPACGSVMRSSDRLKADIAMAKKELRVTFLRGGKVRSQSDERELAGGNTWAEVVLGSGFSRPHWRVYSRSSGNKAE